MPTHATHKTSKHANQRTREDAIDLHDAGQPQRQRAARYIQQSRAGHGQQLNAMSGMCGSPAAHTAHTLLRNSGTCAPRQSALVCPPSGPLSVLAMTQNQSRLVLEETDPATTSALQPSAPPHCAHEQPVKKSGFFCRSCSFRNSSTTSLTNAESDAQLQVGAGGEGKVR